MRIFFVCRGMGEGGGIQRVITEISNEIIKNQLIDELVIVSDNFPKDAVEKRGLKFVKIWSPANRLTKMPRYGLLLASQPVFIMNSSLYLKKHKQEGDIVFNQGVGETLIQDVTVFHSCHTEWVKRKRKNRQTSGYISPLDWIVQLCESLNTKKENTKKIVTVSGLTRDQVEKNFSVSNVEVIPNGVNTERFSRTGNKSMLRKEWNLTEEDFVVLIVANEWKRKGLLTLGKAISMLKEDIPNLKLMMVGRNLGAGYDELISNYDIKDKVIFPGPVDAIEDAYNVSDVFCLPSEEDAFGLVIAEAMSTGLPVIITDRCGIKEYISNGENGHVLPYDSKLSHTIKDSLLELYKEPSLKNNIGRNGQLTVRKEMSWNKIANQYVDIAKKLTGLT